MREPNEEDMKYLHITKKVLLSFEDEVEISGKPP